MKRTLQKLCSTLLALIMLVGVVPSGILTVRAESAPLQSPYWDFTDMTEETLLKDWSIRNEDPDTWELNSNGLTFGACSGDLSWAATYHNMFQTALMGDCIADVRVTLSSYWKQQDAGFNFAIWQDDSNFIKLAYQNVFTGRIWLEAFSGGVQKETATSGDHNQSYTATDVYFRVRKVSNTYSFYYSSDGDDYTKIGNDLTYAFSDPKLCLVTSVNNSDTVPVYCKYVRLSKIASAHPCGDVAPVSWDFKNTTEDEFFQKWVIKNPVESEWQLTSNGLVLKNCGGDLAGSNTYQNLFLTDGGGNYIAETKVELSAAYPVYRQAGLTVYDSDANFVKLMIQHNFVNLSMANDPGANAYLSECPTSIWLRLKKCENTYSGYYSLDGTTWNYIGQRIMNAASPTLGLVSCFYQTGQDTITATFPYLNILSVNAANQLELNKQTLRLKVGETFQLSALAAFGGVLDGVTWSSNDVSTATVSQDGLLTAQAEGYAIIHASSMTDGWGSMVVSVLPAETIYSTHQGNPYLPLWECVPDGEPYVFEDPDNPGKYRIYIYGSHDNRGDNEWCGLNQVVWSASVDDVNTWRYEGVVFESSIAGDTQPLYAPEIAMVEKNGVKTYYYYPFSTGNTAANNVAISDRPDGPFKVADGTNGIMGFDPAVIVDDDGRVYGYWGNSSSHWAELDPETMCTLKDGTSIKVNLPAQSQCDSTVFDASQFNIIVDGNEKKFRYFEGSSIRKIGNKYVLVWARTGAANEPTGARQSLAYAYSDSPAGPWKYGGIIVSSGGEAIRQVDGSYSPTYTCTNIHGGLCQVGDQWYIFYHRGLDGIRPRQAMVEAVTVDWDEAPVTAGGQVRISTAESTSKGFALNGLNPYRQHSAGIVSYLVSNSAVPIGNLYYDNPDYKISINYDRNSTTLPILNIKNGVIAGVKYFDFDQDVEENHQTALCLNLCPKGVDGAVDVFLRPTTAVNTPPVKTDGIITSVGEGSIKLGTVELTADMPQTMTAFTIDASKVDELNGQWGLFFSFRSASADAICDFSTMEFVAEPIHVTSVSIDETLTLEVDEIKALTAHISPKTAADKTVSWSSSDPEIAAVDSNGNVTGIKKGSATITVTTTDGSLTDTCVVTVNDTLVDQAYALIDAIGEVTKDSGEAIEAARTAFDALTDAQKSRVSNAAALSHAERAYDAALAAEVGRLINAIGTVTLDSEERIQTARDAYDRLTDAQKDLVTNLGTLQAAEAALQRLKDTKDDKPNTTPVVAKPSVRDFGKDTAPAASLPFTDVARTAWYYSAVNSAWENRLIDGVSKDRFLPEGELTRAQAIKLAAVLHQLEHTDSVSLTNGSVNWYDSYLSYAVENGIIEEDYAAYTAAQLNAPISRGEFVHIFHGAQSAYAVINTVADNAIPDVNTKDSFAAEIYAFYRAGILTGSDAKGTFHPERSISRAEVAAILVRMYDSDARQSFSLV